HLTNEIERIASDYIKKIDDLGGMLRAIEIGFVQSEIERAAYDYQRAVESGEQTVVGVNRFKMEDSAATPIMRINEELEREQCGRLKEVKARRDERSAGSALDCVERAAASGENLMPHIITAVECYATLGEISDRLRRVFGEYAGLSGD